MKTIYKYPLNSSWTKLNVPEESKFLHFAIQNGIPTVWIEVDFSKETTTVEFYIHGTGHSVGLNQKYLMTAMENGGEFVWHLYTAKVHLP